MLKRATRIYLKLIEMSLKYVAFRNILEFVGLFIGSVFFWTFQILALSVVCACKKNLLNRQKFVFSLWNFDFEVGLVEGFSI